MKKLISVILSAMLVLGMAGCSSETVTDPEIQQGTVILPETDSGDHSGNGEFPSSEQEAPTDTEGEKKPDGTTGDTSTTKPGSTRGNTQSGQTTQKPQTPSEETPSTEKPEDNTPSVSSGEYRAVWLSYLELGSMLTGKSENEFRNNVANAFSNITSLGMNTVIVHVRPFGDALYQSSVFPTSYLITGTEGDALSFDPLSVMIAEAHKQGLKLEAWVNPYRVRANTGKPLSSSNPAQVFLNQGSDAVYRYNNGIYYNPGSEDAVNLIVEGIREIVKNYDVDAIHFDDYFYATTDASIDASLYSQYQSGGGNLSLANWRRANVNSMIRKVYAAIKAIDSSVQFGISPQGNMDINYSTLYADVATWVGSSGYVDYICPQIYYGFEHATFPYDSVLSQFNSMIKVNSIKLYVGLAAYKIGITDNYAGASGKNEWINRSDMLSRMVTSARGASHCSGFVLYSYSSIFAPSSTVQSQVTAECNALKKIL